MNTAFVLGALAQQPAEQGVVDGVGCICNTDYCTVLIRVEPKATRRYSWMNRRFMHVVFKRAFIELQQFRKKEATHR